MSRKTLFDMRSSRMSALKIGVVAMAIVALTGCKDDDITAENPTGPDTPEQIIEGIDLSVSTDAALARSFYNSHLALGGRAAYDVPEHPGMPEIPSDDKLAAMTVLTSDFNFYWTQEPFNTEAPYFVVPKGATVEHNGIAGKGNGILTGDKTPKYYVAGNLTIGGTGGDAPLEIHILPGGTFTCKEVLKPGVTVYLYPGGDILRANQSGDNNIHIQGNFIASGDLVHGDADIEILGDVYTTGKIHGKTVTLVGGEIYAGCSVTAEETIYLTGNKSNIGAGYVSAPIIELAGINPISITLRDGGYLHATEQLRLKNVGNVFVKAEDGDYAMVETKVLDINDKNLNGTFHNVAIKYDTQIGTQEMGADETEVDLQLRESTKRNKDIDYTVEDGDDPCTPKVVEGPKEPDPTPELENIGEISPTDHQHPISATCITTTGKDAYISWHTQGSDFHGCIEHATVDAGQVSLNAYLETAPLNDTYGAIDFNHVIFDNGKVFVAGDHPKKGGILGWIDCQGGTFPTGNTATLNLITLYNYRYEVDGKVVYSNGGSGNCLIRNGAFYQVASVAGFETFNVNDFTPTAKPKAAAQLASWTFNPALTEAPMPGYQRDGKHTGKHIATDGNKVVMLTLINRDNTANTANASIKVYNASDARYENVVASYVVEDALLSPVDGKDVIAINGNDIWVCLGNGGVKHLTLAGSSITETASFRLADKSKEELKGWEMSGKEAAAACANGLAVDNNYVYVAHGGAGLIVLNKTDLSFVTRTRYHGGKSANYIAINEDGYIYVAYGKSKVQVYAWKK